MPSFAAKAAAIRCMTSVRSTAHTSIANASMRFRWREGTKCRSASSAWYISPPPCAAVLGPARNDDLVSPSGAAASAAGPRPTLSIGEVLSQLRGDFPDITISKIRFLEAEGLIRPERTPSGYRRFSIADCERLRFVLTAQRDQYLPLKVIKEQLEAIDSGAATLGVREARARAHSGRNGAPEPGHAMSDSELTAT